MQPGAHAVDVSVYTLTQGMERMLSLAYPIPQTWDRVALLRLNRQLRFRREDVDKDAVLDRKARGLAAGGELGCDASRVAERLGWRAGQQEVLERLLEAKEDGQNGDQQRQPETQPQERRGHGVKV